jgi:pimeloyl-ACP methyl ester carboxylesterase
VEFEHHTAPIKDIKLHYVRAGQGDPVVLLHGWPQNWACWKHVIPGLARTNTVIAPDLRGLGASSKADSGYDTDNLADDIHELVRQLGFETIRLAGHDWGAAVAYSYAAQFRDEVTKLAIFEMVMPGFGIMEEAMVPRPGGNFLWHMGFQSIPDIPFALIQGREDVYLRWFFQHYAYDPSAVSIEDTDEYVRAMRHIGALRAGLEIYKNYFTSAQQNERHKMSKLTIPVMAWAGEACLGPLTRQCMELAADNVAGGVIERCGHWIGEERPDFILDQLEAFFG